MLHLKSLKHLAAAAEAAVKSTTNFQSVRWARKPKGMPVAKSKMFRIPPIPKATPEEMEEIKRLYNNYRTYMKSMYAYFKSKYHVSLQASSDPEQQRALFEEDFARCKELNDSWNSEQKIHREKWAEETLAREIEAAKEHISIEQQKQQAKMELIEEIVRKEKEAAESFITPDKLDAAIEHALANPVDYNFAIDLDGNKIIGRETVPEEKSEKISVKQ